MRAPKLLVSQDHNYNGCAHISAFWVLTLIGYHRSISGLDSPSQQIGRGHVAISVGGKIVLNCRNREPTGFLPTNVSAHAISYDE
jgi:hypothetical protein